MGTGSVWHRPLLARNSDSCRARNVIWNRSKPYRLRQRDRLQCSQAMCRVPIAGTNICQHAKRFCFTFIWIPTEANASVMNQRAAKSLDQLNNLQEASFTTAAKVLSITGAGSATGTTPSILNSHPLMTQWRTAMTGQDSPFASSTQMA